MKLPTLKVEEVVYTPDFFNESLNLCDMTYAYQDFGEGEFAIFAYQLSHITKQYTNQGAGTTIRLRIAHSDKLQLTEPQIKDIILKNFAEYYI